MFQIQTRCHLSSIHFSWRLVGRLIYGMQITNNLWVSSCMRSSKWNHLTVLATWLQWVICVHPSIHPSIPYQLQGSKQRASSTNVCIRQCFQTLQLVRNQGQIIHECIHTCIHPSHPNHENVFVSKSKPFIPTRKLWCIYKLIHCEGENITNHSIARVKLVRQFYSSYGVRNSEVV